jgi:hypothetical protein
MKLTSSRTCYNRLLVCVSMGGHTLWSGPLRLLVRCEQIRKCRTEHVMEGRGCHLRCDTHLWI